MPKVFENIKGKFAKRLVKISLSGDFINIKFPSLTQKRKIKEIFEDLIISIEDVSIFDVSTYPNDFDIKLNDIFYPNQHISEIDEKTLKIGDKLELIVPNRANLIDGNYEVKIQTHTGRIKAKFNEYISAFSKKRTTKIKSQPVKREVLRECSYCGKISTDPYQRICEDCGSDLK